MPTIYFRFLCENNISIESSSKWFQILFGKIQYKKKVILAKKAKLPFFLNQLNTKIESKKSPNLYKCIKSPFKLDLDHTNKSKSK